LRQPGTDQEGERFVSTGLLPSPDLVEELVNEAFTRYRDVSEGDNSDVYPALARVPSQLFGICISGTSRALYEAGDSGVEFTIMSVAKPFTFALVCEWLGAEEARRRIGVNATGQPFNSIEAVERRGDGRTNPMVNAGAIATTSLVPRGSTEERWRLLVDGMSRFAGRELSLDEEVYASASETNHRNRELAMLLAERGALWGGWQEALDLYTRQSSLRVTAHDLAVMGATLADGGVNPVTGERAVGAEACRHALAVMTTAGLYETSGDWLFDVGLPGKSGIGGGIVTVSPGKGGLGTFAPPLDAAGNSVKGQLVAQFLSRKLGLDLFTSRPAVAERA
jgi:glutaminase